MKCSETPSCLVATAPETERSSSREAAAEFAAELTRVAFAPLAKSLGFYGDAAIGATALSIAKRESGGLTDEFERIIERAK